MKPDLEMNESPEHNPQDMTNYTGDIQNTTNNKKMYTKMKNE